VIRAAWPSEDGAVAALVSAAFATAAHSGGNEAEIVAALREADDLALSLVTTDAARIIGYAAFSPVTISDGTAGWYGLGPVAVMPELQGQGIGAKLIRSGIAQMAERGAQGFVVLGDPGYYARFDFKADPRLVYPGVPAAYFQVLKGDGLMPVGEVRYAPAFG
jgi:putative acetyltransferase